MLLYMYTCSLGCDGYTSVWSRQLLPNSQRFVCRLRCIKKSADTVPPSGQLLQTLDEVAWWAIKHVGVESTQLTLMHEAKEKCILYIVDACNNYYYRAGTLSSGMARRDS